MYCDVKEHEPYEEYTCYDDINVIYPRHRRKHHGGRGRGGGGRVGAGALRYELDVEDYEYNDSAMTME